MIPLTWTTWLAGLLALAGFLCLALGLRALWRRRPVRFALDTLTGLLLLTAGALCLTLGVSIQGYRALTRETVAATVTIQPTGPRRFDAQIGLPDGRLLRYALAGDQFYVDAHILKWRPLANLLGLHTAYELDRVAGRYADLAQERVEPRTVYSLAADKPLNLFHLRQRSTLLAPLVDVEYGSASFAAAGRPARFEVRVSTTGLLIRETP